MSGKLHFSKLQSVIPLPEEAADSGNGYYSYSYYTVPFTGLINTRALGTISDIFHKRFYNPPFLSMGDWTVVDQTPTGGLIRFSTTYHHGD